MDSDSPKQPRLELDPDQHLQRLPDLTIHLQSDGSIRTDVGGRDLLWGPHALRVLEVFAQPTTFKEAIETLRPSVLGAQDWVDLSDTIRNLFRAGVLDAAGSISSKPAMRSGFDAPVEHVSMLNDRTRTETYLQAISEAVEPGDVVVELGTGTGILAVAAARAGARHVYAIEAGAIGRVAQSVFRANGLSDRITLVPGSSTHVTLPERAHVLISEIIGNEPLQEHVLESTRDAIQRFLEPDAKFVPRMLRIYAVPVEIPESVVARFRFMESSLATWAEWYGVDFAPLGEANPPHAFRVFLRPHRPREWIRLCEPALLAEIDFATGHSPSLETETLARSTREGLLNGVVVYFELGLSPTHALSVDPAGVDERCNWRIPIWIMPEPVNVKAGQRLKLTYTYGLAGRQSQVSVVPAPLGAMRGPE